LKEFQKFKRKKHSQQQTSHKSLTMSDNGNSTKEEGQSGQPAASAPGALAGIVSSMAASAVQEGANRVNDFSLHVCEVHLRRWAKERSVVAAVEVANVAPGGVIMSPMIESMLKACFISIGGGGTWVVCAPSDQGKTVAAQFLIHGKHNLNPKRSLKIDATNMTDFAKDFAKFLQCSAAESCLSQLLCEALCDTPPRGDVGERAVAKATATAINVAGQYLCVPGKSFALGNLMEMRDAKQHKVLELANSSAPAPILIIDEFDCDTVENQKFVRTLLRDAATKGIVVFLLTLNSVWASKLINLNGGTKIKPLLGNVDNEGYNGSIRFTETPMWNNFYWPVKELRELVRPTCEEFEISPETAIPDDKKLTPGEAMRIARGMGLQKQLERK
jgi:hypothetical protein